MEDISGREQSFDSSWSSPDQAAQVYQRRCFLFRKLPHISFCLGGISPLKACLGRLSCGTKATRGQFWKATLNPKIVLSRGSYTHITPVEQPKTGLERALHRLGIHRASFLHKSSCRMKIMRRELLNSGHSYMLCSPGVCVCVYVFL